MEYKNLTQLKNKHKGEDIWVISAGSSMDYVSSEFFENKIVIGINHVYKHYPCNYIVMKDCMEEPRFPRSIRELDSMGIPLIFSKGLTEAAIIPSRCSSILLLNKDFLAESVSTFSASLINF